MSTESHYRIMKLIETNPEISQRQLAKELGVSVGKINYCMNALIERGMVKAKNFVNSNNKAGYAYFLTPKGVEEKLTLTVNFLKRKQKEYEELKLEIEKLKAEVDDTHHHRSS